MVEVIGSICGAGREGLGIGAQDGIIDAYAAAVGPLDIATQAEPGGVGPKAVFYAGRSTGSIPWYDAQACKRPNSGAKYRISDRISGIRKTWCRDTLAD